MSAAGEMLLAAGVKPLLWHPEPKDGSWAKVPDHGRDAVRGWSFRAAASLEELDALVAEHAAAWGHAGGIGALLGKPSGAIVLEYDPRNEGDLSFLRLAAESHWGAQADVLAKSVVCWKSGRGDGGGGFLMALPSPEDLAALRVLVAGYPGVDLLADGRFQVLPPSVHPDSGKPYEWVVPPGPLLVPQLVPAALRKLAAERARGHEQRALGPGSELPAKITQGARETYLVSVAGSMRHRGLSEDEILAALRAVNLRCVPPLDDGSLERVSRSVGSYPPGADPVLEARLAEWAASVAQPLAEPESAGGLIPTLTELVASPDGLEILKRAALAERARLEVRRARASSEFAAPAPAADLEARLKLPRPEEPWLIENLWKAGQRVVLAALFKTGKSRLAANVVGAVASGTPFLGVPRAVAKRRVCWWNLEMGEHDADDYLAAAVPAGSHADVMMAHLRSSPVPLLRSEPARRWARESLSGCEVWVLDTWTRLCAWNGVDVNDNAGSAELAACLDELMAECGVTELMVLAHMPKSARGEPLAETALGAQSLSGWADCLWFYTRDGEGARYLRMEGRGVDVPEFTVESTDGGMLAATAGNRAEASAGPVKVPAASRQKVLSVIAANDAAGEGRVKMTRNHLREKAGVKQETAGNAVAVLVAEGLIENAGDGSGADWRLTGLGGFVAGSSQVPPSI
jgi:hypothetical protein